MADFLLELLSEEIPARMQAKAATLASDEVLLDLEDATAPSEKAGARAIVVDSLRALDFGRRAVLHHIEK